MVTQLAQIRTGCTFLTDAANYFWRYRGGRFFEKSNNVIHRSIKSNLTTTSGVTASTSGVAASTSGVTVGASGLTTKNKWRNCQH